jgi:hypothetical protein
MGCNRSGTVADYLTVGSTCVVPLVPFLAPFDTADETGLIDPLCFAGFFDWFALDDNLHPDLIRSGVIPAPDSRLGNTIGKRSVRSIVFHHPLEDEYLPRCINAYRIYCIQEILGDTRIWFCRRLMMTTMTTTMTFWIQWTTHDAPVACNPSLRAWCRRVKRICVWNMTPIRLHCC